MNPSRPPSSPRHHDLPWMAAFGMIRSFRKKIPNPPCLCPSRLRTVLAPWRVCTSNCLMKGPMEPTAQLVDRPQKRIVILGGGFAGVYAALRLEKLLAREPEMEILPGQVAITFSCSHRCCTKLPASDLEITKYCQSTPQAAPPRQKSSSVRLIGLIFPNKRVMVSHGHHNDDNHSHSLEYDHLVLALGSIY